MQALPAASATIPLSEAKKESVVALCAGLPTAHMARPKVSKINGLPRFKETCGRGCGGGRRPAHSAVVSRGCLAFCGYGLNEQN